MSSLRTAAEEGRSRSTAAREVGTIPTKDYLFTSKSAISMTELSRTMFFYVVKRHGIKSAGGTGKANDQFLWSVQAINEINKAKRTLKSFKEPRREWKQDPITAETAEL